MDSPVVSSPNVQGSPGSAGTYPPVVLPNGQVLLDGGWQTLTAYNAGDVSVSKRSRGKGAATNQKQIGGPGTLIPPRYGRVRVGAIVSSAVSYQGRFYMLCIWGEGPIDAVEQVFVGDEPIPNGITATHYLGTDTQTVDAAYKAAWAAAGQNYVDTLPNIAYSIMRIQQGANTGFPEFSAIIRGLKIPTSDGGTPTYSTVPAYIAANHITNTRYGMRSVVDWDSVQACADYNNEVMTDGSKRHVLNMSCDQLANAEDWLLTICDYGSIIPVKLGNVWYLIPDAPADSELTLSASPNIVERSLRYRKRGPRNTPTVIEVKYTDTSSNPWKEASAFVYAVGVQEGTVDRVLQRISKPGITTYAQAYRYGLQLLNSYQTSDLNIQFLTKDDALIWTPGTVFTMNDGPFSGKNFRMTQVMPSGPKLFAVYAKEYDAGKWSDVVQTGPSSLDTTLPSALTPPTPTGFAVEEVLTQVQTGVYVSRLRCTWTGPTLDDYLYLRGFSLAVTDGVNLTTYELPFDVFEYLTPAMPENTVYELTLKARSNIAESATPASTAITTTGKEARPGDCQSLTAYSVNGETRIFVGLGVDLDLRSTELRYSDQSTATWEEATFLAFLPVPGKSYFTTMVPVGSRRIWAKMHDSVATPEFPYGQESVNALYCDLEVVANNTSNSTDYPLTEDTLTNMIPDGDGGWVTCISGDSWGELFPDPMNTYTDPVSSYHSPATSSLVTDVVDTGVDEPCTVQLDGLDYANISGTARVFIEYKSEIGDSWSSLDGSLITVQGRYFRAGVEWENSETGHIYALGALRKIVDGTGAFVQESTVGDPMAWLM